MNIAKILRTSIMKIIFERLLEIYRFFLFTASMNFPGISLVVAPRPNKRVTLSFNLFIKVKGYLRNKSIFRNKVALDV